ncbi:hypothetical protein BKA67DRAFT_529257 [Truncatella angustata]|uniref:GPI anchored protein n=1 Tax=Truncatella angustata TaxID=152316 RepID=A0A9P8UW22_9PEZI|nr:uncharacterized protein BKA67DRAFT_529257 [Truncatella angustata]KAH6659069.1 hypothetical protein BKA67DRAFT_529257 [Truncatella angustata]KAH8201220.1 hypothetical protein TruAng_004610 [Truncatella angustata]
MRTGTFAASAAAFAGLVSAVPSATIIIEASHGGAGNGLTNTTIVVPVGPVYTNPDALSTVSTLYLTAASEVAVESISCTPYQTTNGTGGHGLAFTSSTPSFLSTNTVQVGSIVCVSSTGSNGTATTVAPRPTSTGSSSGGGNNTANATSTLLTTYTPTAAPTSTSVPGTSGAMSANVPYAMSALLVGAAGIMFSL